MLLAPLLVFLPPCTSAGVGVGQFTAAGISPEPVWAGPPWGPSLSRGVGHICVAIVSGVPCPFPLMPFALFLPLRASHDSALSPSFTRLAAGVGQHEEALAAMGRSHIGSANKTPLRIEPRVSEPRQDFIEAETEMPSDVFQEDEFRSHLA